MKLNKISLWQQLAYVAFSYQVDSIIFNIAFKCMRSLKQCFVVRFLGLHCCTRVSLYWVCFEWTQHGGRNMVKMKSSI